MRTYLPLYILLLFSVSVFAQNKKKIIIHHSDYSDINEAEIPDAIMLRGNISAEHDGVLINCNKAYFFEKESLFNVKLRTLFIKYMFFFKFLFLIYAT